MTKKQRALEVIERLKKRKYLLSCQSMKVFLKE